MPISDERERGRGETVKQAAINAARRGDSPTESFGADLLAEAFTDPAELAELERIAVETREARNARGAAIAERRLLEKETRHVLKEWDAAEQAERHAKAEAEALRRLGK